MKNFQKSSFHKILIEKINRITAEKNNNDDKYHLTLFIDISPTSLTNINNQLENYNDYITVFKDSNLRHLLTKTIRAQGDYATQGNTGLKTLRLKIKKSDWPEEWNFPENELDRRLFLQNFRLSHLDLIKPFDEGGSEYEKLFPITVKDIEDISFEQNEVSPKKEETPKNDSKEEKTETDSNPAEKNEISVIIESMELIDYLIQEARDASEIEIAKELFEIYKTLAMEAIKLKQEE